jgi:predicted ArsR family transcriptional regulator
MAKLESDNGLIELLRQSGPQSVSELAAAMHVTGTAVRQRLSRLMAGGLIGRDVSHGMRGRPSHRYSLTDKGLRQTGSNFTDLALALWREVRGIKDLEVRRGLMQRIAQAMAGMYGPQVQGETLAERMESVSRVFAERDVPLKVETRDKLPVLTALACPYPALAEQDRGICAVERMLFSELLGESVRLAECRLDGPATCCRFQTN